ncbi:TIGR04211 family SH3 domain-containing protein [Alteromonas sp. D210916BOD_24]|uniref:TIGR04211 family SH3 domain-containing protein n=1 Tax=Alteromonas sp. D210916BOD_24 TaxID=3157618 RepID=UPI00399CF0E7
MIRKWLAAALIACSFPAFSLQDTAEVDATSSHYIRDDLFVFMHTGPGRDYRILGSVNAGTPITVLEKNNEAKFTQITDDEGRTGWIESRYVSDALPQAQRLPIISEQLADAERSLQAAQSDNEQLRLALEEAQQHAASLSSTVKEQAAEIQRIDAKIEGAEKEELMTWFTRGGMVAGAGILLGVLLTYLPKRKRRGDQWM